MVWIERIFKGILICIFVLFLVIYNIKSNSVYYAKNMPKSKESPLELIMLLHNMGWMYIPEIENVEFKEKGYNWINKDGNFYMRQDYTRDANKEKSIWYDDKDENGYLIDKYFKIEYVLDKNRERIQITEEKKEEIKREVIETSKDLVDEVIENNTPIINLQWIFNMIYAKDFK